MSTPFRIKSLTFTNDTDVDISNADIIVLVGANNSGKTRALREIQQLASTHPDQRHHTTCLSIKDMRLEKQMSRRELISWIDEHRTTFADPGFQITGSDGGKEMQFITFYINGSTSNTTWDIAENWHDQSYIGPLSSHLINGLYAGERLQPIGNAPRLKYTAREDHLLQFLMRKKKYEEFAARLKKAFRFNLILDGWENTYMLRVSTTKNQADFKATTEDGTPPDVIAQELELLPHLDMQSDGVKSFSGLMLNLLTTKTAVRLIDEPEAFLHPPQARQLGAVINDLRGEGQVVLATHDANLLVGLLEQTHSKVAVIRLQRSGDTISPSMLRSDDLKMLWSDPFLRYSKTLEGIFHNGVVITEADTDSQFYNAVNQYLKETEANEAFSYLDIAYINSGGKHKIPKLVEALRAVSTPVSVIVDFDVLNNSSPFKEICGSMGASSAQLVGLEKLRASVDIAIRKGDKPHTKASLVAAVTDKLKKFEDTDILPGPVGRDIKELVSGHSGWKEAKKVGVAYVPQGNASEDVEKLLTQLEKLNIYVVRTGALESNIKSVGNHGSEWLSEVMEKDLLKSATSAHILVGKAVQGL